MKTFFYNYWKTISWAIVIAILLFTSGENLPKKSLLQINHLDKFIHFVLFFILTFLILFELDARKEAISLLRKNSIAFLPLIYAASTELIQMFYISNRTGAWFDFIADVLGIIGGIILFSLYKKRFTILS